MPVYRKSSGNGDYPEFGAIFMSSSTTKHECLQRLLFGLPLASLDFVKRVRAGMILFLFEYEKRQLYGVFGAVSDGQADIVPHAYRSSGKSFPAQVRIRVIWNCRPLPEHDFRDAIRDNYYDSHKFKFGLSKQQVQRLLWLFHLKRIGLQKTPAENKAKKRHSTRYSSTSNLEIDSGKTFRRDAALSSGNPPSPAAGITTPHVPAVCGTHDQIATELESDTHNAWALWSSSSSVDRRGKLHEETKHADISLDLSDYIPLSSPDCCDIEVNINAKPCVKGLYSDSPDKRTSPFSRIKLCLHSAAQENEVRSRTMNQYSTHITEAELLPKFVQEEDEKGFETEESVSEILEKLEKCHHDNWMKMRKTGLTKSFEDRGTSVSQRTSVFSRLSFASKSTEQENNVSVFSRLNFASQVYFNDQVNTSSANSRIGMRDASSGSNKRRRNVYPANQKETSVQNFEHPHKMLKGEAEVPAADYRMEDEDRPSKGNMIMLAGPPVAESKPLKTYSRSHRRPLASHYVRK